MKMSESPSLSKSVKSVAHDQSEACTPAYTPMSLNVASALRMYAVGLVFFGLVRVTAQVFYAFKDTATPVKISFVAVAVNICLSLLLVGPLKFKGLALDLSLKF